MRPSTLPKLAIGWPFGISWSPRANVAPSSPPRAANPARPRSGATCRPTSANAAASARPRRGRQDVTLLARASFPATRMTPVGAKANSHQLAKCRRSTRPGRLVEDPAIPDAAVREWLEDSRRDSAGSPQTSRGRVSATNRAKRSLVTGWRSIQNPSTATRCAGASSG